MMNGEAIAIARDGVACRWNGGDGGRTDDMGVLWSKGRLSKMDLGRVRRTRSARSLLRS